MSLENIHSYVKHQTELNVTMYIRMGLHRNVFVFVSRKAVRLCCMFVAGLQCKVDVAYVLMMILKRNDEKSVSTLLHPRRMPSICMCRACYLLLHSKSARNKSRQRKEIVINPQKYTSSLLTLKDHMKCLTYS